MGARMSSAINMCSSPLVLVPAYGRHYATVAKMREDWEAGKDFRIVGMGCYTSVRDIKRLQADASSVTLHDPSTNKFYRVPNAC